MSGLAAWTPEAVTAWGTGALAVGTVGTLLIALRQLTNERTVRRHEEDRRARSEHRRQAEAVSAWYGGGAGSVSYLELANMSHAPVYEVVVSLAFVQGAAPRSTSDWTELGHWEFTRCLVALPPGRFRVEVPSDWGAMMARPGAEVGFTDVGGTHWVRRANGTVEEIGENAVDGFGLDRPVDFVAPIPSGG